MKTQVVFTKTDAIVLENNERPVKHGLLVLTNPKILVDGAPTHYWKIGRNNSVVEMTEDEKRLRDSDIEAFGKLDLDILQPQKEMGAPVSKPLVLQEIKHTPVLHIETKEIRHLEIKPIGSMAHEPINIERVNVLPLKVDPFDVRVGAKVGVDPVTIEKVSVDPVALEAVEINPIEVGITHVAPIKADVDVSTLQIDPVELRPILVRPIEIKLSRNLEILQFIQALCMLLILIYVLVRK